MSPTTVSASFPTTAAFSGDGHRPNAGWFGLIFWPILFGVLLIALIWRLWTWKAKLAKNTTTHPTTISLSTPKLTTDTIQAARVRGAPLVGRPLATHQASIPNPPAPAYIYPPRYDDTPRAGKGPVSSGTHTATAPSG